MEGVRTRWLAMVVISSLEICAHARLPRGTHRIEAYGGLPLPFRASRCLASASDDTLHDHARPACTNSIIRPSPRLTPPPQFRHTPTACETPTSPKPATRLLATPTYDQTDPGNALLLQERVIPVSKKTRTWQASTFNTKDTLRY